MLYFAVARDGHDGGVQITASHNPEGIQRHQDGPEGGVSAERRRRHRRHPRHDRRRPAAAAGGDAGHASRPANVVDDYVKHVMSFIDPSILKPFNVVLDAGSGMAGHGRAAALRAPPVQGLTRAVLRGGRHLPEPRGEPAHRGEPPRHRRAGDRREGGHRHRLGRRRRPRASSSTAPASSSPATSSRRCWPRRSCIKHPGAKIVYDVRASYAVKDTVGEVRRQGADEPRRPRVLQAPDARGRTPSSAARSPGTTTSATTSTPTTASSRRC